MKISFLILLLTLLLGCGKEGDKDPSRCRGADEMQMVCQVEWAEENYNLTIPDWVKERCEDFYPSPGCYYDSSKRHYW
jgi:hypothetical protein